jgi:FtsH-binding integral membrane protein
MSGFEYAPQTAHQAPSMALDAGLRSYMLGIYNKMSLGLALSAAIAWAVGSVPALSSMWLAPQQWSTRFVSPAICSNLNS